jgi:hypothetical protein
VCAYLNSFIVYFRFFSYGDVESERTRQNQTQRGKDKVVQKKKRKSSNNTAMQQQRRKTHNHNHNKTTNLLPTNFFFSSIFQTHGDGDGGTREAEPESLRGCACLAAAWNCACLLLLLVVGVFFF